MSLVTIDDCKAYCRVQSVAEDAQFTKWRAAAIGSVQSFLRRPITAELRTFRLPRPSCYNTETLILPIYPVSPRTDDSDGYEEIAAAVLTDSDAAVIDAANYHFDERIGVFTAVTGVSFTNHPYTVVATVGLSAHPDYDTIVEPIINAAILDLVADRWARRNPAATREDEGGGVGTSYAAVGLSPRVRDELEPWRMARAL